MPTHFNVPLLTAVKYRSGALRDFPTHVGATPEYSSINLDFSSAWEASTTNGPWARGAIGAAAGDTFALTSGETSATQDPGTAASTGTEHFMANAGITTQTSGTRYNFGIAARVVKITNADVFGMVGLNFAAGITAPITTAGAANTANTGAYFRIDGTGIFSAVLVNGATSTTVADTVTHAIGTGWEECSIVASNFSLATASWGAGSGTGEIRWYIGSRLIASATAGTALALTVAGWKPSICSVNGAATTGAHKWDYISYFAKR